MIITKYETREEWLAGRLGLITGSKLKDIVVLRGGGKKKGTYALIAEKIGVPADEERPMDRGQRLEEEAVERFTKETNKKADGSLVLWQREDDKDIAVSPDAMVVDKEGNFSGEEAVEVKCLNSAAHLEAFITKQIPKEYEMQKLQYFITCDTLKTLYFCFYDPRIPSCDFFIIPVTREEVQEDIDTYLEYQRKEILFINEWVIALTF